MERIAIVHYTALPVVGGVENLIERQICLLRGLGHDVRLIVGSGTSGFTSDVVIEPLLDPIHPAIREVRGRGCRDLCLGKRPMVDAVRRKLSTALEGCSQCWVHNVLTLDLHPVLHLALLELMETRKDVGWAAWCHDFSATSAYRAHDRGSGFDRLKDLGITYGTISVARRNELSSFLGIDPDDIAVIPPPVDALQWLDIGSEARWLAQAAELADAEPIALVPAKLLPHKNLEAAIQVAAHLREIVPRPRLLITAAESAHEPAASSALGVELRKRANEEGVSDVVVFAPDVTEEPLTWRGVRDLMLLADVVWIPSAEEGYGLPVREASLLRVPVLCSDIPAFRERQSEGVNVFAADDSPETIAHRLLSFARGADNRGRRNAIGSMRATSRELEKLVDSVRRRQDKCLM